MFRRAVVALTLAVGPSAHAESIDATLARIPRDAIAVVVVPSLKTASDDLQLSLDRMGRAEAALGGRPIDLLKAQARIGPGFDDRGALASWVLPRGDSVAHVAAIPVTDADAFVAGTFSPIPGRDDGAMQWPVGDLTVWVRKTPSHVVVSDRADALGTNEGDAAQGIGPVLAERLGARGGELMRMADLVAWASAPALRRQAGKKVAVHGIGAGDWGRYLRASIHVLLGPARGRMSPFLTMGCMLGRGTPGWNWNLGNALYADCEDGAG